MREIGMRGILNPETLKKFLDYLSSMGVVTMFDGGNSGAGGEGLHNHRRASRQHWNKIPDSVRELVMGIAERVAHYNRERYHESLDNVTPRKVQNLRLAD
jgi:hypothetical protein